MAFPFIQFVLPMLFTVFAWWGSTALIFYLDNLPRHSFRWSMLGATIVTAVALHGLAVSSAQPTVTGAYVAFTCAVLVWGWLQMSFYMGFITGPRMTRCVEGCAGWRHFGHAIMVGLYHEMASIALAAAVVALTWRAPNHVGTWTFMILWSMHISAKLNVFLGVSNLNAEFLPPHLDFIRPFLTQKPMNLLFPLSVGGATVIRGTVGATSSCRRGGSVPTGRLQLFHDHPGVGDPGTLVPGVAAASGTNLEFAMALDARRA